MKGRGGEGSEKGKERKKKKKGRKKREERGKKREKIESEKQWLENYHQDHWGLGTQPTVRKHAGALAVIIAVPNMVPSTFSSQKPGAITKLPL